MTSTEWLLVLQVAAENKALDAAKQGAAKKLRDSEARVEALEATVAELRDELERQVGGSLVSM